MHDIPRNRFLRRLPKFSHPVRIRLGDETYENVHSLGFSRAGRYTQAEIERLMRNPTEQHMPDKQSTTAPDLLIEAADTIGNRAAQRDMPTGERSMGRAVDTFRALTGITLSERDGWVFMAILKLARAQGGALRMDDYIDGAAYIALAGESAQAD